jgi:hypothetical protein
MSAGVSYLCTFIQLRLVQSQIISGMKDLCFSQSNNRKFESNSTSSDTGPEFLKCTLMNSIWLNRTVLHFIVSRVLWRCMRILYVFHYLFHLNSKQTEPIINPLRRHAIRSCSYLLKRLNFYNKIVIYIYLPLNNVIMTNKSKVIWPGRITSTRKVTSAYTIFTETLTGKEHSFDRMLFMRWV